MLLIFLFVFFLFLLFCEKKLKIIKFCSYFYKISSFRKKCSPNSKFVPVTQKRSKLSKCRKYTRLHKMFALPNLFRIFQNCSLFQNWFSRFKKCLCFKNCSRFLHNCSLFQNLFSRFKKCSCFEKLSTLPNLFRSFQNLFSRFKK